MYNSIDSGFLMSQSIKSVLNSMLCFIMLPQTIKITCSRFSFYKIFRSISNTSKFT